MLTPTKFGIVCALLVSMMITTSSQSRGQHFSSCAQGVCCNAGAELGAKVGGSAEPVGIPPQFPCATIERPVSVVFSKKAHLCK